MSHENENPLIIDVVGEVEPPESSERHASKKSGRAAGKKGFFRKEKAASDTTATRAASEAEVDAAKRAAVAASVPPVQGPASQQAAPVQQPAPAQVDAEASAPAQQPEVSAQPQPQVQETVQPVQEAQPQVQGAAQPVQPVQSAQPQPQQPVAAVQPQQPQTEAPQAYVPAQAAPVQPAVEAQPQVQQPAQPAQQQVQQPAQPVQPQVQQPVQPQAQQPVQSAQPAQPVQPSAVPVAVAPQVVQGNMAAAVAAPRRSRAVYVFVILAVLVVLFAAAAVGFLTFFPFGSQTSLAPTVQADLESGEVRPIGSVSLDQASKVSIRATAEGWNEETSTPVIAYIKRVDDASSTADDSSGSSASKTASDDERYFAFAPNKNASVSLPAGRYTFSFIAPMNSDGSMYSVPDMVSMVVGDGGMAVLPVDLTLIPKDDLTQEQITRALAQLKTASEKGGESFDYEPFKKSIDLALNTWFPHGDTTSEQPATDLTQEQQDSLNAQADAQTATQNSGSSGGSSSATPAPHTHTWVTQYQQRWEPEIVPVIDMAAWESPVYARYRCQEGVLFETLDACLAHVRERGNEPYTTSNEIIRIDYHPAVVHYEEQGHYVNVITGYRCSGCGATGTLN